MCLVNSLHRSPRSSQASRGCQYLFLLLQTHLCRNRKQSTGPAAAAACARAASAHPPYNTSSSTEDDCPSGSDLRWRTLLISTPRSTRPPNVAPAMAAPSVYLPARSVRSAARQAEGLFPQQFHEMVDILHDVCEYDTPRKEQYLPLNVVSLSVHCRIARHYIWFDLCALKRLPNLKPKTISHTVQAFFTDRSKPRHSQHHRVSVCRTATAVHIK